MPRDSALRLLLVALVPCLLASGVNDRGQADGGSVRGSGHHILFLMADQFRWDAASYARGADPATPRSRAFRTPSLDRIASEGLTMLNSYSSTPTCTPARAALLTGQSPWNHGMLGYGSVARSYPHEFPRILSESGAYMTASIGKDHFGWDAATNQGVPHGYQTTSLYDGLGSYPTPTSHQGEYDDYDQWFGRVMPGQDPQKTLDGMDGDGWNGWNGRAFAYDEYYHPTAWVGRQAISFLQQYANRSRQSEQLPFLLKVSFHRPHSPYDPPQRLLDQVRPQDLPPVQLCQLANGSAGAPPPPDDTGKGPGWCLRFRGMPGDPTGCGPSPDAWCGAMPEPNVTTGRRAYAASVQHVDEQIGLLYSTLVETQLLNHTWIIFTSDHGDGQGTHYHWRKGYPYDFSARVPMLLRWPEAWSPTPCARSRQSLGPARGMIITAPLVSELRDVFHTIIDAAGLATNELVGRRPRNAFGPADGKSLLCLLIDPSGQHCDYPINPGPWRRWVDLEHSTCYNASNHWNALTDGRTKYVFRALEAEEQMFDLVKDPGETIDVSNTPEYQAVIALWRSRLVQQFEREGRGSGWVQGGQLVRRPRGQTYSPNYPGNPTA